MADWREQAKQSLKSRGYVAPEKRSYELKLNDGTNFGEISYGAYKAVRDNTLDSYTPTSQRDKEAINKYKSYITKSAYGDFIVGGSDENPILSIPITNAKNATLSLNTVKNIDDYINNNKGKKAYEIAKGLDNFIRSNYKDEERQNALSYAGIKKLSLLDEKRKNVKGLGLSQLPAKFVAGMYDMANSASRGFKTIANKLDNSGVSYNEEYQKAQKYYEENPDALGNDLFNLENIYGAAHDYLSKLSVDDWLKRYENTNKVMQFIGDAGFRSAGQMAGAYGMSGVFGIPQTSSIVKNNPLVNLGVNAASKTKAGSVASKVISSAPEIKKLSGNGAVSKIANKAIDKANSVTAGKALKFLNPLDNPTTAIMSIGAAQDKYDELVKNGYDRETAKKNALFTGYVSAVTEKMGFDGAPEKMLYTMSGFKPGSVSVSKAKNAGTILKNYLSSSVGEGVEEIYNLVFERLGDKISKVGYVDDNGKLQQRKIFGNEGIFDVKGSFENFLGGAVGGAVMGASGILGTIANYDVKQLRNHSSDIKSVTDTMNDRMRKILNENGIKDINMPKSPDWKKTTLSEINDYYEKTTSTLDKILGRVQYMDAAKENAYNLSDDRYVYESNNNFGEANSSMPISSNYFTQSETMEKVKSDVPETNDLPVKNISNNIINRMYSKVKAKPATLAAEVIEHTNNAVVNDNSAVITPQFVENYAAVYSDALKNSVTAKKVGGSSELTNALTNDVVYNNIAPELQNNANYRTVSNEFKNILKKSVELINTIKTENGTANNTFLSQVSGILNDDYSGINIQSENSVSESAPDTEAVSSTEPTVKDINLTKVGDFYEAYGDEAVELADKLNLTLTPKKVNGQTVQVVGFPADSLERYAQTLGGSFNISVSDTPNATNLTGQSTPATTENTVVNKDTTDTGIIDHAKGADGLKLIDTEENTLINGKTLITGVYELNSDKDFSRKSYKKEKFDFFRVTGNPWAETVSGTTYGHYGFYKNKDGRYVTMHLQTGAAISLVETESKAKSLIKALDDNLPELPVSIKSFLDGYRYFGITQELSDSIKNIINSSDKPVVTKIQDGKVPFSTKSGLVNYVKTHIGDKVRVTFNNGESEVRTLESINNTKLRTKKPDGSNSIADLKGIKYSDSGFSIDYSTGVSVTYDFINTAEIPEKQSTSITDTPESEIEYTPYRRGQITKRDAGIFYKAYKNDKINALPETSRMLYNQADLLIKFARQRYNRDHTFYDRIEDLMKALVNEKYSDAQNIVDEIEEDLIKRSGQKSLFYKYKQRLDDGENIKSIKGIVSDNKISETDKEGVTNTEKTEENAPAEIDTSNADAFNGNIETFDDAIEALGVDREILTDVASQVVDGSPINVISAYKDLKASVDREKAKRYYDSKLSEDVPIRRVNMCVDVDLRNLLTTYAEKVKEVVESGFSSDAIFNNKAILNMSDDDLKLVNDILEGRGPEITETGLTNESESDTMVSEKVKEDFKVGDIKDSAENVHDGILGRKGENDNSVRKSESVSEADEKAAKISDIMLEKLASGKKITSDELFKTAADIYGGSMADNTFTSKDAYDALELAVNRYILSLDNISESKMLELMNNLPSQTKRTDGMDKFQQFSTPPSIAYLANYAANINANDTMLEPSAGIGGIAVFAKRDGAKVIVNELDTRRLGILKNMPFDAFYNENAEQLNNILGGKIEPTVIVMNPPFSSSSERNIKNTKVGAKHIEEALKILKPNGRLAAIVGHGMSDDAPAFRSWWKDIKQKYNVVANIGIDGKNYNKYGTNFDVQLLVIDKNGSTENETITGKYSDLKDVEKLLGGIRDGRPEQHIQTERGRTGISSAAERGNSGLEQRKSEPAREKTSRSTGDRNKSENIVSDTGSNENNRTESRKFGDRENDVRRPDRPDERASGNVGTRTDILDNELPDADTGGRRDVGSGRENSEAVREQNREVGSGNSSENAQNKNTQRADNVDSTEHDSTVAERRKPRKRKVKQLTDSVFEQYEVQPLTVKGAKPHPARVSESAAMSTVSMPPLTYKPTFDKKIIEGGILSDVQLEAVSYAGQAHEQVLPDGSTRGFFLGDGTGIGKGRTISGVILDNFNKGRKKAIWISENTKLAKDAERDITALFGDKNVLHIFEGGKKTEKSLDFDEGILFTTYSAVSKGYDKEGSNLEKIVNWLGKDFDGVIAFDEAHNMKNTGLSQGRRGRVQASGYSLAGLELQKLLPKARVIYSSATGATEVENLVYADRLGLWGEGTPFISNKDFVSKIKSGGIAAMEVVASDMKSNGVYLSRNISYDDVEYSKVIHKLTDQQIEVYDEVARAWQIVLENLEEALKETNQIKDGNAKGRAVGAFWSSQQRFFNQIITAMQAPTVIEDIQKQLDEGKSCVIQLTSTNEASQKREFERIQENGLDLEDFDLTPRQMLMDYIEKSFPVQQYENYRDDNGNIKSKPVYDSQGAPVINREAVKMREQLLDKLGSIKVPDSPIDMIISHFGSDMVAENTGRSKRVITKDGKHIVEPLSKTKALADVEAFQNGQKRIIIFSKAGGTGKSYHADKSAKNQQQRVHYLFEPGWQADIAVQGFGRSHRSNQAVAPIFKLVSTDLKGQARFMSTIAKRLAQLGAITKGQRSAGSQGFFSDSDNLENGVSADTLANYFHDLVSGKVPGIPDGELILKKLGLKDKILDEYGRIRAGANELRDVVKFLNRILVLEVRVQNDVFNGYFNKLQEATEAAIANGTLDRGLENYKADHVIVNESKVVKEDKKTKATTTYYSLTAKHKIKPTKFSDLDTHLPGFQGFFKNKNTGAVRAVWKSGSRTDASGIVSDNFRLVGADKKQYIPEQRLRTGWDKISTEEAKAAWNKEVAELPEFREEKLHLLKGNLLSVWDKLPSQGVRVYRVLTDDGEMLVGRIIPENDIDGTLLRLGAERTKPKISVSDIISNIKSGNTIVLDNDWKLMQRRVSGEQRIELTGPNYFTEGLEKKGVFTERIGYRTRYFIPVNTNTEKIIGSLMENRFVKEVRSDNDYDLNTSNSGDVGRWVSRNKNNVQENESSLSENENNPKDKKDAVKSLPEIINSIEKLFDIPISTGNVNYREARGVFKRMPETIRLKVANDLPTAIHELGHYIDKRTNLSSSEYIGQAMNIANEEFLNQYPENKRPGEAVAEFARLFCKDESNVKKLAPDFYKDFVSTLESINMLDDVKSVAKLTQAYMSLPMEDRLSKAVSSSKQTKKQQIKNVLNYEMREKFMSDYVDNYIAIKKATSEAKGMSDKKIRSSEDAYILATNSRNAASVAAYVISDAMTDIDGNINIGESLYDRLKGIDDLDEFNNYLVLKHAIEWIAPENKDVKIKRVFADDERLNNAESVLEMTATMEKKHPEYSEYAEKIYSYQRDVLTNFAVTSGLMSGKMVDYLYELYPHYVPFYRLKDGGKDIHGRKAKAAFANQRSPIMHAKGSGQSIISPIESIVSNTEKIVKSAMRHRTARALARYADSIEGFGSLMERVPPDVMPHTVDITNYKEKLQEALSYEMNENELDNITDIIDGIFGDTITGYTPITVQGKHIVTVMNNGEAQYYQIHDDMLYTALTEMNPQQLSGILQISSKLMLPMKLLITQNNPIFIFTNALRDFQTAYKNSDTVNNPFKYTADYFAALKDIIKNTDDYKKYKALGGGHSSKLTAEMDSIKKQLRVINNVDKNAVERIGSNIKSVTEMIATVNDTVEQIPRFAEFKRNIKDRQKAIYAADDITTNFKRMGTKGRKMNAAFLYSNASVQGLDKMVRSFTDVSSKERSRRIWKYIISAFIMTALQAFWNRKTDDEADDYENLSSYMKNNYYNFSIGGGNFIRIPKARELSLIDSMMERCIDKGFGDKDTFYDFGGYVAQQLLPSFIPNDYSSPKSIIHDVLGNTVAGPFADIAFNEDFKGTPIVSSAYKNFNGLDKVPKKEQYTGKTSAAAVGLGKMLNVSPLQIDHILSSYGGILGQLNSAITIEPANIDATLGLKNKFVANSNYSTDKLNIAYERRDKAYTKYLNSGSSKDAVNYERYAQLADYITEANKAVKNLPGKAQANARNGILTVVKGWNMQNNSVDTKLIKEFSGINSDDWLMTKLPSSTIEYTKNKEKFYYTMTPQEYTQYTRRVLETVKEHKESAVNSNKFNRADSETKAAIIKDTISDAKSKAKSDFIKANSKKFKSENEK